jgi:hypothetical protein
MFILCFLFSLLFSVYSLRPVARNKTNEIEFKGITFVGDKYCPEVSYDDPMSLASLNLLKDTGANWVAIVVTEYQDNHNSTNIYPLYEGNYIVNDYYVYKTETLNGLVNVINHAHSIGLNVMLKPHIDLAKIDDYNITWRGNIGQNFTTQEQWDNWFNSYNRFILKYAGLAEKLDVEMFSISCELIATSKMSEYWLDTVKQIRKIYNGKLIDSANHDGEEYNKTWWSELDYIGVDAYYLPIRSGDLIEFEKNVEHVLEPTIEKLRSLSLKYNKEVIITEVGFCSGNCIIGKRDNRPSLTDHYIQAYFYETFLKVFSKEKFVKGFFWWAWNSDPFYGGTDDNCISPQYKMAEYVIRNYYGGNVNKTIYTPMKAAKCKCTI